ncbi:gephyrin-like molybdotransferase Glp [Arhodomonas aquaeolei]|uniref:molybdopterin molybdotransferase MoeA n=1 Tax=Arhodomonas aquaeolei TaxID=2369 RepID=UPI00036032FF|nr:gephyrin-like molybdotransferase Glp [Arhodomonas aquaeolei]
MIPIEEALAACTRTMPAMPVETVAVSDARGTVLAEDVASALMLPPFTQSAMDGYAVRAADLAAATERDPVRLPLAGEVAAAVQAGTPRLSPGQCMRIFTGGLVPEGADAIVRQEIVEAAGGEAVFTGPVAAGNNVRARGEELPRGTPLLAAGERLSAARVAALAAAGIDRVAVRRAPRVRVLVTGDEVVPAGADLPAGAVPDANGPMLAGWLAERGVVDVVVRYVHDDAGAVREAMAEALETGDIVVSTGGVSVGEHDLVIPTARGLGVEEVFWRVRQKPGKPLFLGVNAAGVPLLGLPGNPAATLVGAAVYLRRMLDVAQGMSDPGPRWRPAVTAAELPGDSARACWVRVSRGMDEAARVTVTPATHQASHMLSNLCVADAIVHVPAGETAVPAGRIVQWLPIDGGA